LLPSCNLGLDVLNGKDESIDVEDFLGGKIQQSTWRMGISEEI
jgi:hypothetical protein